MQEDNTQTIINMALADFQCGMNCSQAVALAFSDLVDCSKTDIMRLTSGCGLGMGAMEGTCGALCGAILIANLVTTKNGLNKAESYEIVRKITKEFLQKNGSIICKELKGVATGKVLRSCQGCVEDAVRILQKHLINNRRNNNV